MTDVPRFGSLWQTVGVSLRGLVPGRDSGRSDRADDGDEQPESPADVACSTRGWVERQLTSLLAQHGTGLLDEPGRCERLLRRRCGVYRTEVYILTACLERGVPQELRRRSQDGFVTGATVQELAASLQRDLPLQGGNARWGVCAWARALGCPTADAEDHGG